MAIYGEMAILEPLLQRPIARRPDDHLCAIPEEKRPYPDTRLMIIYGEIIFYDTSRSRSAQPPAPCV